MKRFEFGMWMLIGGGFAGMLYLLVIVTTYSEADRNRPSIVQPFFESLWPFFFDATGGGTPHSVFIMFVFVVLAVIGLLLMYGGSDQ